MKKCQERSLNVSTSIEIFLHVWVNKKRKFIIIQSHHNSNLFPSYCHICFQRLVIDNFFNLQFRVKHKVLLDAFAHKKSSSWTVRVEWTSSLLVRQYCYCYLHNRAMQKESSNTKKVDNTLQNVGYFLILSECRVYLCEKRKTVNSKHNWGKSSWDSALHLCPLKCYLIC